MNDIQKNFLIIWSNSTGISSLEKNKFYKIFFASNIKTRTSFNLLDDIIKQNKLNKKKINDSIDTKCAACALNVIFSSRKVCNLLSDIFGCDYVTCASAKKAVMFYIESRNKQPTMEIE